jgi:hypothetical protein
MTGKHIRATRWLAMTAERTVPLLHGRLVRLDNGKVRREFVEQAEQLAQF